MKQLSQIIITISILLISILSVEAQRAILFEKFTNAYCGSCAGATEDLKELTAQYPDMIWVSHHSNPGWTENDLSNPQSDILQADLEVYGNPLGMINRTPVDGALLNSPSKWPGLIESIESSDSPIEIVTESVAYDESSRELQITIGVNVLEQLLPSEYNLSIMLVEDKVTGLEQHSYFNDVPGHPLEGRGDIIWDYEHRHVVREIHEGAWGTPELFDHSFEAGSYISNDYTIALSEEYNLQNLSIVAVVAHHDLNTSNRGVVDAQKFTFLSLNIVSNTEEELSEFPVTIYPNPATDQLQITSDVRITSVELINSLGQSVLKVSNASTIEDIDVSALANGMYQCVLRSSDGITIKNLSIH